ncbi:MAG: 2-oxo-3-deoxygalactonate 6-phosphate aldolase and galactonate dehydratase [Devosia sp.]|uniref:enolase C-terminal domain-like protein n=1 Tax=Devosia sp. TaxID=1871048 RepID=UPI002632D676|nr:enolase C-terminal domain-like protein [Devosia sp.]MDB5529543.1 2-oxo-3-deoxygalactonate 6-phosphate aldolase and galactonate dehydratase [Devosia sp.]
MKITGFTGWLVETEPGPKFIWRDGLPGSHGDIPRGTKPRKAVIRMETDSGLVGAIEVGRGDAVIDLVRRRYNWFIGENPLLTERMWNLMWEIDRIEEVHMRSLGMLDMLCWDVKSQQAKMPIYQLLGGHDRVVPAYASTVTWPTMDEYERYIKMSRDLGFTAFKLHAWGDVKRDIALSTNLRKWVGPDADLMFDGSAGWDYVQALEFGKAIQDLGFLWYEEPMREFYLGAYAKLCDKLDIPVLAAETSDGVHWNMASWIEGKALDMTRVSTFYKGGFTGAMKIAHMSESFGMRAQVHGMGLENAQLCAAISNNDYYEQLIMNEEQIKGLDKLGPLAIVGGNLTVTDEPGLGYHYDWDALDKAALTKIEVTERLA